MSLLNSAMNYANADILLNDGEDFDVVKGGNLGTYTATSINDLAFSAKVVPGGKIADPTLVIWIKSTVIAAADITEGKTILLVRGKRLRVKSIKYDGHDTNAVECGSAGVTV